MLLRCVKGDFIDAHFNHNSDGGVLFPFNPPPVSQCNIQRECGRMNFMIDTLRACKCSIQLKLCKCLQSNSSSQSKVIALERGKCVFQSFPFQLFHPLSIYALSQWKRVNDWTYLSMLKFLLMRIVESNIVPLHVHRSNNQSIHIKFE